MPELSSCCPTDSLKEPLQMSVSDKDSSRPEEGKASLCRPFRDRNQTDQRNSGKPILSPLKNEDGVSKMAQPVKALVLKPDDRSSGPRDAVGGES